MPLTKQRHLQERRVSSTVERQSLVLVLEQHHCIDGHLQQSAAVSRAVTGESML